jgi:hypothetical protein
MFGPRPIGFSVRHNRVEKTVRNADLAGISLQAARDLVTAQNQFGPAMGLSEADPDRCLDTYGARFSAEPALEDCIGCHAYSPDAPAGVRPKAFCSGFPPLWLTLQICVQPLKALPVRGQGSRASPTLP